jgi:hypothetical protein
MTIFDSGANVCMTDCRDMFTSVLRGADLPVAGIKGSLRATGVGTGSVLLGGSVFHLTQVYFVPGLGRTLLSMPAMVEDRGRPA